MADDTVPMVGIVVVNYFGGDLTLRCLASLERLTWPRARLAVALVDNGSAPGELAVIRDRFPDVRVVENGTNLGFGGACNRGFDALRDCKYVALLNNDAVPDPGWLQPLVEVLEAEPTVGAAIPKILLSGRYVGVELRSPSARPGAGDRRALGVQLCSARVDGADVSDRVQLVSGFWGWEHDAVTIGGSFAWTDGAGVCRLPVPPGKQTTVELRLACGRGPTKAEVVAGEDLHVLDVDLRPAWFDLGPVDGVVDLVNSAGMVLLPDGATADRGFMHPDGPDYASPMEVFGWSGAAVLLSRRYIGEVGGFDEPFFLYYEDADLSWRGRASGWTYRYEPRATVRHDHSATIGERSAMAQHLLKRNRLITLVKNAPRRVVGHAFANAMRSLAATVVHDVLHRAVRLRRPVIRHAVDEVRVLVGVVRLLPGAMQQRRATSGSTRDAVWAEHARTGTATA